MVNRSLADSSFLYALFDTSEAKHQQAVAFARSQESQLLVPNVVLTEVAFLFKRNGGIPAVVAFLSLLDKATPVIIGATRTDLQRTRTIFEQCKDNYKLDFVDCVIMALSERLEIESVCTFDRRDFSIFKPRHCEYLRLLPD